MKPQAIKYENETHFVVQVATGYEVYKSGITCATRVARIGWPKSDKGLHRAIEEADKRAAIEQNH